jgi:hypothetical protein
VPGGNESGLCDAEPGVPGGNESGLCDDGPSVPGGNESDRGDTVPGANESGRGDTGRWVPGARGFDCGESSEPDRRKPARGGSGPNGSDTGRTGSRVPGRNGSGPRESGRGSAGCWAGWFPLGERWASRSEYRARPDDQLGPAVPERGGSCAFRSAERLASPYGRDTSPGPRDSPKGRISPGWSSGGCGCRVKGRISVDGRRHAGTSSSSGSSAAPAFDHGLCGVALPFNRVRSRESPPVPPFAAPESPECPVSSTARSSLAPAEATVWLQWR